MSVAIPTESVTYYWTAVVFFIIAVGLCCLMLIGGRFLGGRSYGRDKNIPFESGINSVGSARLRLSVKFHLIAMFFVTFDVEALYLFAWSVSIRETGWIGLIEATVFILILLVSLIYLARIGALDWTSTRSCTNQINMKESLITNNNKETI